MKFYEPIVVIREIDFLHKNFMINHLFSSLKIKMSNKEHKMLQKRSSDLNEKVGLGPKNRSLKTRKTSRAQKKMQKQSQHRYSKPKTVNSHLIMMIFQSPHDLPHQQILRGAQRQQSHQKRKIQVINLKQKVQSRNLKFSKMLY